MVRAFVSEWSRLGSSPSREHCAMFLGKPRYSHISAHFMLQKRGYAPAWWATWIVWGLYLTMGDKSSWDSWLNRVPTAKFHLFPFKSGLDWDSSPSPFSMLYRKEANSRDRKSNIERVGGGSMVEMRKEICLKWSNMAKGNNTFVDHC